MKRYNKLIFVDDDDNSRAPMAKIIMRSKYLLGPMEVESRGLVVLFPEPMNQKAEAVLISNGYHVADHVAKQLVQEDIGDDVLILTMEATRICSPSPTAWRTRRRIRSGKTMRALKMSTR